VVALLCFGSVMVASASMPYAEYMHENPFYYVIRHGFRLLLLRGGLFNLSNFTEYMV
jgi:cell division protein FtsW